MNEVSRPITAIVRDLKNFHGDFIQELAEELMLSEMLAGECDAKDFLIESMEQVVKKRLRNYHEMRVEELSK